MEPILRGEWLQPGSHLNAVGFNGPASREIDTEAVAGARLFVDRRESTLNEAGEFLQGLREGAFTEDHIAGELGELLLGRVAGRQSTGEITLFRSLGVGVEDVAAAKYVYDQARSQGAGTPAAL
jgi:ornithine cyclodeaminase